MKRNLQIFCTSINYHKVIDTLPDYIYPLGLGENTFPTNWYNEKNGKNISNLNQYYGELTGLYWIWKNELQKYSDDLSFYLALKFYPFQQNVKIY